MYLQTDPRWANIKIHGTNLLVKNKGCLICCLGWFWKITPDVIANSDVFNASGEVVWAKFIAKFGGEYLGSSASSMSNPTIGQTIISGGTHFVGIQDGKQLDPLGRSSSYKIYSYRNIRPPKGEEGETMSSEEYLKLRNRLDTAETNLRANNDKLANIEKRLLTVENNVRETNDIINSNKLKTIRKDLEEVKTSLPESFDATITVK